MSRVVNFSWRAIAAILLLTALLGGCKAQNPLAEKDFVGKWKSSRASTPIQMFENGEWELLSEDGGVMQYGVWQVFDNKIMWSYIDDDRFGHDTNPILAASASEFRLREADGSVTTFVRLN